jgi:hypothetical protein
LTLAFPGNLADLQERNDDAAFRAALREELGVLGVDLNTIVSVTLSEGSILATVVIRDNEAAAVRIQQLLRDERVQVSFTRSSGGTFTATAYDPAVGRSTSEEEAGLSTPLIIVIVLALLLAIAVVSIFVVARYRRHRSDVFSTAIAAGKTTAFENPIYNASASNSGAYDGNARSGTGEEEGGYMESKLVKG